MINRTSGILIALTFIAGISQWFPPAVPNTVTLAASITDAPHQSVVYLGTTESSLDGSWGRGTGVVVKVFGDGSAWILTAAHVITQHGNTGGFVDPKCEIMYARFSDGSVHKVEYVKHGDSNEDLALYRVERSPVPAVAIATENVRPGDKLYLQGAAHRPAGTRNYEFISNPMTWDDEVFGDGDCWTGESGTAILNASGELVSILTGGWREVRKQDGSRDTKSNPNNMFEVTQRVYPILGMSNTDDVREFLGADIVKTKKETHASFRIYSGGKLDTADGVRRIVQFSAEWCGPCQQLKRTLKSMLSELGEAGIDEVVYVDLDKYPTFKSTYGITTFPTTYLFDNGNVLLRRVGYFGRNQILNWCKK